jgi:hypothetical protein
VLALGWQVNPQLTPAQMMKELLFKSAYIKEGGYKIINPQGFIAEIKELKGKRNNSEKERDFIRQDCGPSLKATDF